MYSWNNLAHSHTQTTSKRLEHLERNTIQSLSALMHAAKCAYYRMCCMPLNWSHADGIYRTRWEKSMLCIYYDFPRFIPLTVSIKCWTNDAIAYILEQFSIIIAAILPTFCCCLYFFSVYTPKTLFSWCLKRVPHNFIDPTKFDEHQKSHWNIENPCFDQVFSFCLHCERHFFFKLLSDFYVVREIHIRIQRWTNNQSLFILVFFHFVCGFTSDL